MTDRADRPVVEDRGPVLDLGAVGLRIARRGDSLTVELQGELDLFGADALVRLLSSRVDADEPTCLVLDLSELSFLDSSGVRALLQLERRAADRGCALRLLRPQPIVWRVLDISGLGEHFTVERDGS